MIPQKNELVQNRNGMYYYFLSEAKPFWLIKAKNKISMQTHYEVWKVKKYRGRYPNKWNLIFPRSEEFGYYGWSFNSLIHAKKKLRELKEVLNE